MEFTILMPCLNEAETIGLCIQKARHSITRYNLQAEILIADNGSTDASVDIATSLGARVVHVKNKGYGSALRAGIESANGEFIIMADADDSYDFSDIFPFVTKLREGFDLVMGNRFSGGIEENAMPFLHRYLGNPALTFIGKLFFNVSIGDFHCGFRAFRRESILNIRLTTTGMEFASEMIVRCSLSDYKISEVAVKLYPDGRSRPPHLRTWHDGWRHLRFLLLYSPRWLFLYPGQLLSFVGVCVMSLLYSHSLKVGQIMFDVHTMLYAAVAFLIGAQMIIFYCYSKLFSDKVDLSEGGRFIQYVCRHFSLERGIVAGVMILVFGLVLSLYSFRIWTDGAFGNLDPSIMLRIVIPAVTFLMFGTQIIFNSFFACILRLNARRS